MVRVVERSADATIRAEGRGCDVRDGCEGRRSDRDSKIDVPLRRDCCGV